MVAVEETGGRRQRWADARPERGEGKEGEAKRERQRQDVRTGGTKGRDWQVQSDE